MTAAGNIDLSSNILTEAKTINFDALYNNGNSTASWTLTLSNGQHQEVTLNATSVAMTISATGITGPGVWTILVKQDVTGGRAITSGTISGGTVYYTGTSEPTFPSATTAMCKMVVEYDGTNCTCQVTEVLTTWT
jgi:predicted secreted protein